MDDDSTIFKAERIRVVYTYPGDEKEPEKEYHVGGFAVGPVLERCDVDSLIKLYVEFEKMRYTFQTIIGQRDIGELIDREAGKCFNVGKRLGTYEAGLKKAGASKPASRTAKLPEPDFSDLELED